MSFNFKYFIVIVVLFLSFYLLIKINKKNILEKMSPDNQIDLIYENVMDNNLGINGLISLIKSKFPENEQCPASMDLVNRFRGSDIKKRFLKYFDTLNGNEQMLYFTSVSNICAKN